MQPLARDGYTEQEVKDALHGRRGARDLRFRYKLLDKNENEKMELSTVVSGEVSMGQFDDIKRTAKFKIKDDPNINWMTDRIQPIVDVKMPSVSRIHDDYALKFGGVSDYATKVSPSNLSKGSDPFTISAKINIDNLSIKRGIVSIGVFGVSNEANALAIGTDGALQHYFWANDILVPTAKFDFRSHLNEWVDVSVTFDGISRKIFINGELMATDNPIGVNVVIGDLLIGKTYSGEYFSGKISNVQMWNKSLTQGEIRSNMGEYLFGDESGLIGLWRLNEGSGSVADDVIGGNDVTISGAIWEKVGVEFETIRSKYVSFPLGVFLLKSPKEKEENGVIYREVEAYDGTLVLKDDKFISRYVITAGTNYKQAMISILASAGITKYNIADTDKTVPVDLEYAVGEEKIKAINSLASSINFIPIIVDPYGYYTSYQYISPQVRPADYDYKDDHLSVMYNGMERETDTWDIPNKWVGVLSESERNPFVSVYTNDNPSSPTSTVSLGRSVVRMLELENIADQNALDAYIQRVAFESSQIFGKLVFETALMPHHGYADVLAITYNGLNINNEKYAETGWTLPLDTGGRMKHEMRRVVNV